MVLGTFICSLILVASLCAAYRLKSSGPLAGIFIAAGCLGVFSLAFFFLNGAGFIYLSLIATTILARCIKFSARRYSLLCGGVIAAVFGVMMVNYIPIYQEHQRMLVTFAPQDLSSRLYYEPRMEQTPINNSGYYYEQDDQVAPGMSPTVKVLENAMSRDLYADRKWFRQRGLHSLAGIHNGFIQDFMDQPGFGVGRIPSMVVLREHHVVLPEADLIPQPPPPTSVPASPGEVVNDVTLAPPPVETPAKVSSLVQPVTDLPEFNVLQVANFASSETFGLVTAKRVARGFQSHAFRMPPAEVTLPDAGVRWKLGRLELVSLLRHHPAAVYLSEHLPAMDELKDASTRGLDDFESSALAKIEKGEDIVIEPDRNVQRMVGSIRAARQCTECHAVERGELLGAFTYRFYRDPQLPNMQHIEHDKTAQAQQADHVLVRLDR